MGEVYEAEDTRKGRVVALKLISPDFSDDPMFRARMQREAGAAGRLTEPHIVPIHDYGEINGQLYLDMRLIDGADLASVLKRTGPMSPPRAVAIVRQVAAALDAAHAGGVTHRDVKPENILITGDDFAYLLDFGIDRADTDPGLTQAGMALGTYRYMAPERFSDHEVTYRSDIYSLACVLGECLTGTPPFRADSIERLVAAHLMEPAPRPSQLRPGKVPAALDQVIAQGMAKNPEDRYRSAGDLANAALQALTVSEQHQAESILSAARRGRRQRPHHGSSGGSRRGREEFLCTAGRCSGLGSSLGRVVTRTAGRHPATRLQFPFATTARPAQAVDDHRRRRRVARRRVRVCGAAAWWTGRRVLRTKRAAVQRPQLPPLARRGGGGFRRRGICHQSGHVRPGGEVDTRIGHPDGPAVRRPVPTAGGGR
jgi:serine/threonine-protein kinase